MFKPEYLPMLFVGTPLKRVGDSLKILTEDGGVLFNKIRLS